jgi:hypothetical protein
VALVRERSIPTEWPPLVGEVSANRLCGLVVRVPGCRFRGPGSIPGATRFFWEVEGLERDPLSLVSTIDELLGRNSSGSGPKNREYGREDPFRWRRDALYPQKLINPNNLYNSRTEYPCLKCVAYKPLIYTSFSRKAMSKVPANKGAVGEPGDMVYEKGFINVMPDKLNTRDLYLDGPQSRSGRHVEAKILDTTWTWTPIIRSSSIQPVPIAIRLPHLLQA